MQNKMSQQDGLELDALDVMFTAKDLIGMVILAVDGIYIREKIALITYLQRILGPIGQRWIIILDLDTRQRT